jgi:lycopene cyclase domain-containing protein
MKFTYLLINFITIAAPFVFSFHPRSRFYKTWVAFFPSVILTGLIFLWWDANFVNRGVWGFNGQYLSGIWVGGLTGSTVLPLEEALFFLCIPYACVFTFHCLQNRIGGRINKRKEDIFTVGLTVFLLLLATWNYTRLYTFVACTSLAGLLLFARYALKIKWLAKFYIVYAILLFPFFIVNGILTGTGLEDPVVWYNPKEITGIRIFTIPFEDIFYGMELIFVNLLLYQYLLEKNVNKIGLSPRHKII